jgi:hypothetical protein
MITKKKLHWIKNGTEYSAHLITSRLPHRPVTPPVCQLAVQVDGQTLYTADTSVNPIDNMLSFKRGVYTRWVKDIVPTVTIASSITSNPAPYSYPRVVNWIEMTLNVAINNPIELQYYVNYAWVTLLTLPAGSVSAYDSGGYRLPDDKWRVKVGSWTSMFQQYTGSDSTTRNIPEAYWGV